MNKSKPEYFFFDCSDIRYIIVEENGKGKEYEYNGKLIYEGEYLNWKRNGKGKEYDYEGRLKYEGEYLNEIKNGKGKKYKNGGFKVTILEGNIGEEIIDTSSKIIKQCEEGGMDDLD